MDAPQKIPGSAISKKTVNGLNLLKNPSWAPDTALNTIP